MIENRRFWKILRLFCFATLTASSLILISTTASYAQSPLVDPPCKTSTCISGQAIGVAHGSEVEFDKMMTFSKLIAPKPKCVNPRPTGVTVHKQLQRRLKLFPDGFCTNQGCFPVNDGTLCIQ